MKKQNIIAVSILILVLLSGVVFYRINQVDKTETSKSTTVIFDKYKIDLPQILQIEEEKEHYSVKIYRNNPDSYVYVDKITFEGDFEIYYEESGEEKTMFIRYKDGSWEAHTSDEEEWWGIVSTDVGPFVYMPWNYTENSYTYYVLVNENTIFEVSTDFPEYKELVPVIATSISILNEEKPIAVKDKNAPPEKSYYFVEPTEVPDNMPFRDIVLKLKSDESFDVSIDDVVEREEGTVWYVDAINKERNFQRGMRGSPDYYDDVVSFTIYEDLERFYKRISDENDARKEFNPYKLPYPGEIEEIDLFGVTWKYFDFEDGYDGGFTRDYFYIKDNNVITFTMADNIIEGNKEIMDIPKVKYLENLSF